MPWNALQVTPVLRNTVSTFVYTMACLRRRVLRAVPGHFPVSSRRLCLGRRPVLSDHVMSLQLPTLHTFGRVLVQSVQASRPKCGAKNLASRSNRSSSTGFLNMQVLFEDLPVALAGVDCDGNETAISECQSNNNRIGECSRVTTSTVLACANSAPGTQLPRMHNAGLQMCLCIVQSLMHCLQESCACCPCVHS